MHAIQQHEYGPPGKLLYEELPDLVPAEGQVRIAVEAAGVHLIDTAIRRGESWGYPVPELPMVPGREVAGLVDDVGPGVNGEWSGRRVVAHLGPVSGGYAERAVVSAESLHEISEGLAADAAVAGIGTGRTAMAILEVAELSPDDVVLVTAAAGGLGNLFVQAALGVGATVVGVAGGDETSAPCGRRSSPTTASPAGATAWARLSATGSRPWSSTASAGASAAKRWSCSAREGGSCCSAGRRASPHRSRPRT